MPLFQRKQIALLEKSTSQLQWSIQPPIFHSLNYPYSMVWFQYHCNPPDLFYPSDSQWNMFFVPHPCLLPLTCSLNLSPCTEDGKLISLRCAVTYPAVSLTGHLLSGIIRRVVFPGHVLLLLNTEQWLQETDPFLPPFSRHVNLHTWYEALHLLWRPCLNS